MASWGGSGTEDDEVLAPAPILLRPSDPDEVADATREKVV
jgi:hypothetical protein